MSIHTNNTHKQYSTKTSSYKYQSLFTFNIALLGNISVGKSSIINRFVFDTYSNNYLSTIGVDVQKKTVKVKENSAYVSLNIWDTCGEERFLSLTKMYLRNKEGVIIVFDLSDKDSFYGIYNWIEAVKTVSSEKTVIIIVGNKYDKLISNNRCVSEKDLDLFLSSLDVDFEYIEVSAKENININELFLTISKILIEKNMMEEEKEREKEKEINNSMFLNSSFYEMSKGVSQDLTVVERNKKYISVKDVTLKKKKSENCC